MTISLSELEHDALTELVNMSVGRSASALSDMVGSEIQLSVPDVQVVTSQQVSELLHKRASADVALVRQGYEGALSGQCMLAFPQANSLELVRLILDEDMPLEELTDLEQEVLREVGNVVLNGFMGSLSNSLDVTLKTDIPEYERVSIDDGFIGDTSSANDFLLFIQVDFNVKSQNINGFLLLAVAVQSIETLLTLVNRFLEG